ncbi:peptidylprolyl isomerase [Nocardioides sp. AX2bis]|uniref:peptidylprolyl isomerase n=1 Tax=Nocardioides sp. AX2bis TaxID=2653157 RepID=UPI0012F238D1|nr:peptidylprolyl isomerase [Nocardioides sp. AX2bis]VXB18284.1 Peptidyl-prolyl cis-trans isomerase [Nocardioides sp. AX2bis]
MIRPLRRAVRRPLSAAAVLVALSGGLAACGEDSTTATEEPAAEGESCAYPSAGTAAKEVDAPPATATETGEVTATITTSAGDVPITLDADAAPCTVNSFVSLAEQDYFTDTPCHRLTTAGIFVLQCGDPSGSGTGGPGYSFPDELTGDETYGPGTLAMANAGPDTNGSQFFMVFDDSPLDPDYTVFGSISEEGLAVVQEVADAGAEGGAPDGPPAEPVDITGVTIG